MSAIACAVAFTLLGIALSVILRRPPRAIPPRAIRTLTIKCCNCGSACDFPLMDADRTRPLMEGLYTMTPDGDLTVEADPWAPFCFCGSLVRAEAASTRGTDTWYRDRVRRAKENFR